MHHTTKNEYLKWIRSVIEDYSALIPFMDWMTEQNMNMQKWQEVVNLLPKVIGYYSQIKHSTCIWLALITKQQHITIRLVGECLSIKIIRKFYTGENINAEFYIKKYNYTRVGKVIC